MREEDLDIEDAPSEEEPSNEDAIYVTRMAGRGFEDCLSVRPPDYWEENQKILLFDLVEDAVVKGEIGLEVFTKPRGGVTSERYLGTGNIEDHIALTMGSSLIAKGALDKATALALGGIRTGFTSTNVIVQGYSLLTRSMTPQNAADFPMPKPRKPRAKKGT